MKAGTFRTLILAMVIVITTTVFTFAAKPTPFSVEDQYLNQARMERIRVVIVIMSGERLEGYIKTFDDTVILVESTDDILLYKHAISSVYAAGGNFRIDASE